ncbi:MAG: hypothetical protein J6K61_06280 [Clostridia bacterium]|nr:hypothetical protein [Clostridia bacterium]
MNSALLEKSMGFVTQTVLFYEEFSKSKKLSSAEKSLLLPRSLSFLLLVVFRQQKSPRSFGLWLGLFGFWV